MGVKKNLLEQKLTSGYLFGSYRLNLEPKKKSADFDKKASKGLEILKKNRSYIYDYFLKHVSLIDICYSESEPGVFGPTLAPALSPKCSCKLWLFGYKKGRSRRLWLRNKYKVDSWSRCRHKDFTPILECSHNLPGATLFWIEGPAAPTGWLLNKSAAGPKGAAADFSTAWSYIILFNIWL